MTALGFDRAEAADTGRPGYDPRDLLKLLFVRLSESNSLIAAIGSRVPWECGSDVAAWQASLSLLC